MKSIFDQYKALNEGTLGQAQFLRNVKMALPKIISNVSSFKDAVTILKSKGIISEAKADDYAHYCNPQEYDLGMRYELDKGTEHDKASKIVYKNLADNAAYYSQLHLAGYNEDVMKSYKKRDGSSLDVEVKKDNFLDKKNQMKKVKMDKLTEDEMIVLVGNILAEVADQKKTNLTESIEDQIQQRTQKRIDYRQEHYGTVEDSEKKLYRILSINDLKSNPNLSDEDRAYLDAEFDKLKDKSSSSNPTAGLTPDIYASLGKGRFKND
jgi:tRNA splicing endonuclease